MLSGGYQRRFADFPEDVSHRWAQWFKDFYERGNSLNDEACRPLRLCCRCYGPRV
jgi:hypothetical protein